MATFEGEKLPDDNGTMSDNQVVAFDVPRGTYSYFLRCLIDYQ